MLCKINNLFVGIRSNNESYTDINLFPFFLKGLEKFDYILVFVILVVSYRL